MSKPRPTRKQLDALLDAYKSSLNRNRAGWGPKGALMASHSFQTVHSLREGGLLALDKTLPKGTPERLHITLSGLDALGGYRA